VALNLPIQTVIDRRVGFPVFLPDAQPNPQEQAIVLDEAGGSYGHLPGDPPPVRCDPRSAVCAMPSPLVTSPIAVATMRGI